MDKLNGNRPDYTPEGAVGTIAYEMLKAAAADTYGFLAKQVAKARGTDPLAMAARAYEQLMIAKCRSVRMWRMQEALNLEDIFVQARFTKRMSRDKRRFLEQLEGLRTEVEKISGAEILNLDSNIIVLGGPGSGKTTFLKAVLHRLVEGAATNDKLPMFTSAKELGDTGETLIERLSRELSSCGLEGAQKALLQWMTEGKVAVFLDGLDEISSKPRLKSIVREFLDLSHRYPQCTFLTSCRSAAYDAWLDGFLEAEIAPFDKGRIEEFTRRWFVNSERLANNCLRDMIQRPEAGELACNPLMLTLICACFEENGTISANKAELHKEALDGLLGRWDAKRSIERDVPYREMPKGKKQMMFAHIARLSLDAQKEVWDRAELEKEITVFATKFKAPDDPEIDGEHMLKAIEIQHGIFQFTSHNHVSFSHQAFRDYYAAQNIIGQLPEKGLASLLSGQLDEPRRAEVTQLVVALLPEADFVMNVMREPALDDSTCRESLRNVLSRFSTSVGRGTPMVTRMYSVLCAMYQIRPLTMAFDMAMSRAHRQNWLEGTKFLDALAERLLDRVSAWAQQEIAYRHNQSRARPSLPGAEELARMEAIMTLGRGRPSFSKSAVDIIGLIGPAPSGHILELVDLDRDREDIGAEHRPAYDLGVGIRSLLRRQLLIVDCINAGCHISSVLRTDIEQGLFPAGLGEMLIQ